MDPSAWFIHTCTRKARSATRSAKGDPIFGSATPFKARVEKKRALVRAANGEMVASAYVLMTQELITDEDLVWFPSIAGEAADDTANDNAARSPLSIEIATTKAGEAHLVRVYF